MAVFENDNELIKCLESLIKIDQKLLAEGPPYPGQFFMHGSSSPEEDIKKLQSVIDMYQNQSLTNP